MIATSVVAVLGLLFFKPLAMLFQIEACCFRSAKQLSKVALLGVALRVGPKMGSPLPRAAERQNRPGQLLHRLSKGGNVRLAVVTERDWNVHPLKANVCGFLTVGFLIRKLSTFAWLAVTNDRFEAFCFDLLKLFYRKRRGNLDIRF